MEKDFLCKILNLPRGMDEKREKWQIFYNYIGAVMTILAQCKCNIDVLSDKTNGPRGNVYSYLG